VTGVQTCALPIWLVRREIDRACELSCDEAVIRNLDADGKQNYGDTLIYVAADSKTPHAVLSTTMCEEKKALKERLGAIMQSRKHSKLSAVISLILFFTIVGSAAVLGAGREELIHNFNAIFVNDIGVDVKATEGVTIELYETGIERLTIFRAYGDEESDAVIKETFDKNNISDIENFFGKGTAGTYSESQGLKYMKYTGVNGVTATFIYINGVDGGIENRVIRVIITPPTSDNSSPPRSWWERLFTSESSADSIQWEHGGQESHSLDFENAVRLSGSPLEMRVHTLGSTQQITGELLNTNTTKIQVKVGNMGDSSEILLFLYDVAYEESHINEPIGYAVLNANNKTATFTNLTSAKLYRVGAITNGDNLVILQITDGS
jgi:hypothetical protein